MTNWTDPATEAACAKFFSRLLLALVGLYGWEVITRAVDDWRFVKRLVWAPLWTKFSIVVYFLCKYGTLISVIGLNYTANATHLRQCQLVYTWNEFWGNMGIGGASTLLMMRCFAIWRHSANSRASWPLAILSLGQWVLLLYGVTTVRSSPGPAGCIVTDAGPRFLTILYAYTMALDFTVLVMTLWGLSRLGTPNSTLWRLLSRDSIMYCAVAFTANVISTIFIVMRLNAVMEIIFTIPACVISTIVACRSFNRVDKFKEAREQREQELLRLPAAVHFPPPNVARNSGSRTHNVQNPALLTLPDDRELGPNYEVHTISALPFKDKDGIFGAINTLPPPPPTRYPQSQIVRTPPLPLNALDPASSFTSFPPHNSRRYKRRPSHPPRPASDTSRSNSAGSKTLLHSKTRWDSDYPDTDSMKGAGEESAMLFASIHDDMIDPLSSRQTTVEGDMPSVDVILDRTSSNGLDVG